MDEKKGTLANTSRVQAFRFGNSPQNHISKDYETEKWMTRKVESANCLNLISPRDTVCYDTGVSRVTSPKTQENEIIRDKKYLDVINRLNSEIYILSLQLKQSNEIISHFTIKLNEISKNFLALRQITDELKAKVFKLENENFVLRLENKNLNKSGEVMKRHQRCESEARVLETSNDSGLGFKGEGLRGDYDEITRMINSKIIQGIDEIIDRFKEESDVSGDIIKAKDFRGIISEECRSIIRKSLNM